MDALDIANRVAVCLFYIWVLRRIRQSMRELDEDISATYARRRGESQ